MLERIKKERLQPEIQIKIAQSIYLDLDNMCSSQFSYFNYKIFIEEIVNYDWENDIVDEYL